MKCAALLIMMTFMYSLSAGAATYEWTDNKGVVNFTDNPDKIPPQYLKKAIKRPSITGAQAGSTAEGINQGQAPVAPGQEPATQNSANLYGGHDQSWWQSRFASIRDELKAIQDGLAGKKDDLLDLRRALTLYGAGHDRKAYYDKLEEIKNDEAREIELREQLKNLDIEASRAAVPLGWRQ
jgi:hypothetical protein